MTSDQPEPAQPSTPPSPPAPPPPAAYPPAPYPPAPYPPAPYPPGHYPPGSYPALQTSGKAIASMVLGIVGLTGACAYGLGVIAGIVGLVLGYVARREIRQAGGRLTGSGMAVAGIVLGWASIAVGVLLIAFIVLMIVTGDPTVVEQSTQIQ